ncbi:unnamed protein product [Staurois parvus]|uniref:Uncharacterized protein n=1 Tax=Staurois parvus TaxID=386267 RepID=A0ABN9HMP5_9NEOB|nr:unnamed protein product [Staurois parvus]
MRGSGESRYREWQGPGRADLVNAGLRRPDIVNAGSGESGYSECRVRGDRIYSECGGPGESGYIVNAGSGERGYSECGVPGRERYIVNAGSGGDQI